MSSFVKRHEAHARSDRKIERDLIGGDGRQQWQQKKNKRESGVSTGVLSKADGGNRHNIGTNN